MIQIKRLIKKNPILAFSAVIAMRILPGYFQYCKLVRQFGKETAILRTAWHGTGDYYICGMYLPAYLQENGIHDFVFLVNDIGSEIKVTELFHVYQGHILKVRSAAGLSRFSEFMQWENPLCKNFECSDQLTFIGDNLKGYRGLTLMDFYLYYGFCFQRDPGACMPHFSKDINRIRRDMYEKNLVSGKTVLLAPYSTCSKKYLPPGSFWEHIAECLKKSGYTVATNCIGKELPVKGTKRLSIAYPDIVPFLNEAGYFIGIRSGLCDIISQSSCRKIVIHTAQSDFWPDGRSKLFVGLCSMKLDQTAIELKYSGDIDQLEKEISDILRI